jgi:hypothetical protein
MPLASGKDGLKSALLDVFNDVDKEKSASDRADKWSAAIKDFVLTGMPMTIIVTMPGGVLPAGATGGPVMGKGIGGFDKPAPGMTLKGAKMILKTQLTKIFGPGKSADEKADQISTAIFSYFSQAMVQTMDMSSGPDMIAAPGPGPMLVQGMIKGKGGVNDDSPASPGKGYSSAKSDLKDALQKAFENVKDGEKSAGDQADKIATAIHNFCIEGKVDTMGMYIAPYATAVPPPPPAGAFMPGVGMSTMGKIA